MNKKVKEIAEKFLIAHGFKKEKGFAINTQEMNPNDYDEIFFDGTTLEKAIKDYFRKVEEYWVYEPSDGEQMFEDIEEAIDYAEDGSETSFEDFKKKMIKDAKAKGDGK